MVAARPRGPAGTGCDLLPATPSCRKPPAPGCREVEETRRAPSPPGGGEAQQEVEKDAELRRDTMEVKGAELRRAEVQKEEAALVAAGGGGARTVGAAEARGEGALPRFARPRDARSRASTTVGAAEAHRQGETSLHAPDPAASSYAGPCAARIRRSRAGFSASDVPATRDRSARRATASSLDPATLHRWSRCQMP
jgi:hypothetical protein